MIMSEIKIIPEDLRDAADFITTTGQDLMDEVKNIKTLIENVVADWSGLAQSSFVDSFENDMYPVLNETMPTVLEGLAEQMKGAADALEQTDEAIASALKGEQ